MHYIMKSVENRVLFKFWGEELFNGRQFDHNINCLSVDYDNTRWPFEHFENLSDALCFI